jgi:hypothetical protein
MEGVELPGYMVQFAGEKCKVLVNRYWKIPNLCLYLVSTNGDETPVATATVYCHDHAVPDTHVMIKDYTENEGMVAALMTAGIIGDYSPELTRAPGLAYTFLPDLPPGLSTVNN